MRKRFVWAGVALLGLVLFTAVISAAASSSLWTERYTVGEEVLFNVEDETVCCWCCCCQPTCEESQILGWHVSDSNGGIIYSVVHDAPVPSSVWEGSWPQIDSTGGQALAGYYYLHVDTSVGTLTRSLCIYDPCSCCWPMGFCRNWTCCGQTSTITDCCCRTSLLFIEEEEPCCQLFLRWPCCP